MSRFFLIFSPILTTTKTHVETNNFLYFLNNPSHSPIDQFSNHSIKAKMEPLLGKRTHSLDPTIGSSCFIVGISIFLYVINAFFFNQDDININSFNIGFLSVFASALILLGLLIACSSFPNESTNNPSTKRRTVLKIFVTVILITTETCSFIVTFKLTKRTAPRYIFQPNAYSSPSKLLTHGTLENKMRYTLYPRLLEADAIQAGAPYPNANTASTLPPSSTIPGTFSLAMHVEVGSLDENEKERGIAHFVEHLCFDASTKFNSRYGIWQALDRLGVNANAFTTSRSTVYEHFDVKNTSTSIDQVIQIAKEQLLYTIPTKENIDIEKGAVIGEWRMRNDTQSILDDRETCQYFGAQSSVCQRFPIGIVQKIKSFNPQLVEIFLNKWYHPSRTHLLITGDFKVSDMVPRLEKHFGQATRNDGGTPVSKNAAGKIKVQQHRDFKKGSAKGVFVDALESDSDFNSTSSTSAYQININKDILNYDGIEFRLIASDPSHASWYDFKPTNEIKFRNVQEILFSYVYSHMVQESVQERYPEIDISELLDFDATSSLNDDFDRNSRYHTWKLYIGMGFSGEKGASEIVAKDNQWMNELEAALIELKRLSEYGVDQGLLTKAMDDYRARNQKRTDTFYSKSSSEVIEELYGDRSTQFVWRSPWEIEQNEHAMIHPSFSSSHSESLQAEATLQWETITHIFGIKDLPVETLDTNQRRAKISQRGIFTVFHGDKLNNPPSTKSIRNIVRKVADLSLSPKISSLESVKSDRSLLDDQEEEDTRNEKRKRKYVNKDRSYARDRKTKTTPTTRTTRTTPTTRPTRSNDDSTTSTSETSASTSDSGSFLNRPYLIDVDKLQEKKLIMLSIMDEAKEAKSFANDTRTHGAVIVETHTHLLTRYRLLNGIGVNIMTTAATDSISTTNTTLSAPTGPKGQINMEITSLGGKSTLNGNLIGACHLVNLHKKYAEGYGVRYASKGNPDDDDEEFTVTQFDEALLNSGSDASESSTSTSSTSSSSSSSPSSSSSSSSIFTGNDTHSTPGPAGPPSISCEDEFTTLSMLLSSPCKPSTTCVPSLDPRHLGSEWATSFVPDLLLARVLLRPKFTTRSLRRAYVDMLDSEAAKKRDYEPGNVAQSHATDLLLTSIPGNDPRLQKPRSQNMKMLNPTEVTNWSRQQFTPDRIEINIVGDFGDTWNNMTSLLDDLNVVFGTISPFNKTLNVHRAGFDPYSKNDVKHFVRTFNNVKQDSTNVLNEACWVKHLHSRRSYLTTLVPSYDAVSVRDTTMSLMASHLTKRLIWSAVRKENGLSYTVHTSNFHSWLFPNYGYTSISIEVGTYNSKDTTTDPMNVLYSVETIRKSLEKNRDYGIKLFEDSKEQLKMEVQNNYVNVEAWLKVLKGMSLKIPIGMSLKAGDGNTIKTLKNVEQMNLLEMVEKTNLKEFIEWTKANGPSSEIVLNSLVETVDEQDAPVHSKKECDLAL